MLLLTSQRDTGEAVAETSGVRRLLRSAPNAIRPVAPATQLGDDTPVRASERPASASDIKQILCGGDPRSLHGVDKVIAAALADPSALEALFECLFCADAVVGMRAGDALEKIARIQPEALAPFTRRLLSDVVDVDQPSIQWHLAQILTEIELTAQQRQRAIAILKRNLERYEDWIVITSRSARSRTSPATTPGYTANWYRSCEATKPTPASQSTSARPSSSRSYSKRHNPQPELAAHGAKSRTSPSLESPADGKADPPGKILVLRPQELERERPVSALELPQPGPCRGDRWYLGAKTEQ
jgi:hypothetical protein